MAYYADGPHRGRAQKTMALLGLSVPNVCCKLNDKSKKLFSILRHTYLSLQQSQILQSFHTTWAFMTSHISTISECIPVMP